MQIRVVKNNSLIILIIISIVALPEILKGGPIRISGYLIIKKAFYQDYNDEDMYYDDANDYELFFSTSLCKCINYVINDYSCLRQKNKSDTSIIMLKPIDKLMYSTPGFNYIKRNQSFYDKIDKANLYAMINDLIYKYQEINMNKTKKKTTVYYIFEISWDVIRGRDILTNYKPKTFSDLKKVEIIKKTYYYYTTDFSYLKYLFLITQ
jgi:hypothetical protein